MSEYRSLFDVSGRTALVVGSGSGIGRASAAALAAFGLFGFSLRINRFIFCQSSYQTCLTFIRNMGLKKLIVCSARLLPDLPGSFPRQNMYLNIRIIRFSS